MVDIINLGNSVDQTFNNISSDDVMKSRVFVMTPTVAKSIEVQLLSMDCHTVILDKIDLL